MKGQSRRSRAGRPTVSERFTPRGYRASAILRACPGCDAPAGHQCQRWKMDKGERIFVMGTKSRMCEERRSAA